AIKTIAKRLDRAGSPAYSMSSFGVEDKYGGLFGSDDDDILNEQELRSVEASPQRSPRFESPTGSVEPLRKAAKSEVVADVFERFRLRDGLLARKLENIAVEDSTVFFSSDGAAPRSEIMPVWSSLLTDLTLKHLSAALAMKAEKAAADRFRLSFRGESHITDEGIRWLCETLKGGDANRAKTLTVDADIRQCPGLTANSVHLLLNTFGSKSTVRSDLLSGIPDSPAELQPDLSAALSVSSLLFLTPPDLQYSPLRTVKECRLRPAVRGTAADSQFMEAGGLLKVAAVELCLS
uniref:Rad60-SLD domain-containing protein n=1 Tax=Macrostomum lignano TaxID=282301 RepID=A0A1I8HF08_9PLAT